MEIGDQVANFSLPDQYGNSQSLYEYLDLGPVILFFYPKAMTKGCTKETCRFRDLTPEFTHLGALRIGVSNDSVERQFKFSELHHLNYPLLCDTEQRVAHQFGVHRRFAPRPTKRWTFLIDSDRSLIEIIKNEIRVELHADQALETLRHLAESN